MDWARREDDTPDIPNNIPGRGEAEEDEIVPYGWSGTRDMLEEVRRARTTGSTIHLQTSQEVKDVPDGWRGNNGKDEH